MSDQGLVLIVEDEPKIAKLLQDYLQQSHYETHWLDSGDAVDNFFGGIDFGGLGMPSLPGFPTGGP